MAESRTDSNHSQSSNHAPAAKPDTPGAEGANTGIGTGASAGAGAARKLAGPKEPDLTAVHETPVMGIVPPEPSKPDEAGDIDYTLGDATRVRQGTRGSETPDGEETARENQRKELYEKGATEVSEID